MVRNAMKMNEFVIKFQRMRAMFSIWYETVRATWQALRSCCEKIKKNKL